MAIASLIIGLTVSLYTLSVYLMLLTPDYSPPPFLFVLFILSPTVSIIGLGLGILALIKKKRGRIAIAGIVLNSLPIIFVLVVIVAFALAA